MNKGSETPMYCIKAAASASLRALKSVQSVVTKPYNESSSENNKSAEHLK